MSEPQEWDVIIDLEALADSGDIPAKPSEQLRQLIKAYRLIRLEKSELFNQLVFYNDKLGWLKKAIAVNSQLNITFEK